MVEWFQQKISIQTLWILAVLVGIFFFLNTHPIRPHDFWWHMAAGKEILASGSIPSVDTYSYTMAGQPYPSYNSFWLMEIFLYSVYTAGGPAWVVFLHSLLITSAYTLLLWLCWRVSGSGRAAALGVLFSAALGFQDWNVRPQAVTFFLGVLYLAAIHGYRTSRKAAWLLAFPLGMLVWVNSHGSFPIGLGLIFLWLVDEAWQLWKTRNADGKYKSFKSLLAPASALALTLLACLANPSGLDILGYFETMAGNPAVQNLVPEWAPPSFGTIQGGLFYSLLVLTLALLAFSPRRPGFFELAALLIFAGLSLRTSRGIVWYGLVMAPVIAARLSAKRTSSARPLRRSTGSPAVNASILLMLAGMALLSLPWFKEALPWRGVKAGLVSGETPIGATQYLLEHRLPGNLFHTMAFGSYLIWAAQPQYPVFVDSRIELYPLETWMDYVEINSAVPGWDNRLGSYDANTLMLSPAESAGLIAAAQADSDWVEVYQDEAAILFVRRNP